MESSEDTAPLADEYVEEFVLDHFGDMNIKKEAAAVANANGGTDEDMLPAVTSTAATSSTPSSSSPSTAMSISSSGPAAPTPTSNSDEDCNDKKSTAFLVDCRSETTELTHIGCNSSSTVSSSVEDQLHHPNHHPNHQYQPSGDDAVSPEAASHSLLTPPTSLHLMHTPHHYSHLSPTSSSSSSHLQHTHHPSGIVLANPKSAGNPAGSANSSLIVYQNIHGTPPDTPPVVHNSPSPQGCGYPVAHAQSHYTQPMYPKGPSSFMDEMVLLTTHPYRQEPLDLRPNCNSGSSNNENHLDSGGGGGTEGGGLPLGQQNWNVMQHTTSVIAAGNSKRMFYPDDYIHPQHHHHHHHNHNHNHHQLQQHHPHQYQQQQQQPDLLLSTPQFLSSGDGNGQIGSSIALAVNNCPASPSIGGGGATSGRIPTTKVISEAGRSSSRSGRGHTVVIPSDFNENTSSSNSSSCNGSIISSATNSSVGGVISKIRLIGSHGNDGCGEMNISDDMLLCLTVKDLNKRLQGIPKDLIAMLKQKRRTLKNRGYAQNCRSKRLVQRQELELSKQSLQQDLSRIKVQLQRAVEERDFYRSRYHEMLKLQGIHHHHSSIQDINTRQNMYSINVNHSVAATAGAPENLYL